MQQTNAVIYLANQRGCTQSDNSRSYHTFSFGDFIQNNLPLTRALYVLNDDTLAGNQAISLRVEENTDVLLLPIVGGIEVKTQNPKSEIQNPKSTEGVYIGAGKAGIFSAEKDTVFTISNPFKTELVNFLQIWFKNDTPQLNAIPKTKSFNFNKNKNTLIPLFLNKKTDNFSYIGQFGGREEGIYRLKNPSNGVFAFVIEGAFEVQNRLLETRDSLILWDIAEAEFEALSDGAVLLLMEIKI